MTLRRVPAVAALAIGAGLICQQPGETAQPSLPRALLGVPLSPEYRDADRALAKQLGQALQIEIKHDDKFITYADLIERVTTTTDRYLVRMTPYAFVAAEMLGARLEVLATYESVATGTTTYQSYFVVNAKKFQGFQANSDGIHDYLRKLPKPARFVYHDKFSTSSYLLPALWFRSHQIFATEQPANSVLRVEAPSSSSSESVEKVAADQADLAAVWDGTKSKFQENLAVQFVPFSLTLPNDLLVASMSLDEATKAAIRKAIDGSHEIAIGDFKRWRNIDDAREALKALNELKRVAKKPPAPVVVRVNADLANHSEDVRERLLTLTDDARQAIRLASTEFVLEDPKSHDAADVIWTVKWVHDGAIRLGSEMQVSSRDLKERLKQEFHVSFTPTEGDLTTRIVSLIHSRMHRVRYLWPYQERAPTVIRDVDFAISMGEKVHVQRLTWRDPDRNDYVPAEAFDTVPVAISAATFAFDKSDFVRTSTGTVDFQNPMSDVAYKVVLERRPHESTISKIFAGSFIALFLLTGAGAAFDLRRRLLPRPEQPPRTFPQLYTDMAARLHRVWNEDTLTDADVLFCNRPRVEEQIEELKARGLVPASMGGITRLAYGVTAGVGVPFVKALLSGEVSRNVELVLDQSKVGDTMRLSALLDLMIRKQLMSGFVGRPLEWDALNESVRTNLPSAEGGDLLIRPEDETVVKIASRHFGQVLNDGMKNLSLLRGAWTVSKQDGRCVAQQRIELQGPIQVRGARLTAMLVEFNIPSDVEGVDDGLSPTLECWVVGKIVRHSIVDDAGVPILWLHIRTVALLMDKGLSEE
jgi:ABC-type phosphate/phosphonate transport system substrate-binding protein